MSQQLPCLPPMDCRHGGQRSASNPTVVETDETSITALARAHLHLPTPTTLVAALSLNMGHTRLSSFNGNGMTPRTDIQGRRNQLVQSLDEAIEILNMDHVYVRSRGSSRNSRYLPQNECRQ